MNLQHRMDLLVRLGEYMISDATEWQQAKEKAQIQNAWFIPEFIDLAVQNIAQKFLRPEALQTLVETYKIPEENSSPKKVGIVMAGNVPLVGFHDLLCAFMAGHFAAIKFSSKDEVLGTHLLKKLAEWDAATTNYFVPSLLLKGCDAYIATGSNNTARYFEFYFKNVPHIIRKNRTSAAILTGQETGEELQRLADDIHLYFGLGCRNVTKLYVPEGYDFLPLLNACRKYHYLIDHNKYKNNYDYHLAVHLLNNKYYMTNGSLLLIEDAALFSPISQVNYEYYTDEMLVREKLQQSEEVQCIVGRNEIHFGIAQMPDVTDFADGVDTISFLINLVPTV